jgi:hypothetical protein
MTKATTIELDIAKQVFPVLGADKGGRAVVRRKLRQREVAQFFSEQPPCLVEIEAIETAGTGICALLLTMRRCLKIKLNGKLRFGCGLILGSVHAGKSVHGFASWCVASLSTAWTGNFE